MGGNALKIAKTRRYQKKEYLDLVLEFRTILNNLNITSEIPAWYSNKDSFGDLDILIKKSSLNNDVYSLIQKRFKPTEIYCNNTVYSFDYKEFQIDFILVEDENWETSINYFSYNDLGNLMGRVAYQLGFRFGDYGLKLICLHENEGRKFETIVSKNPKKIYEFLGFDYERYLKGFDTIEDVFDFVVDSSYFKPEIFSYDKLNHQNKTRNKKRKNYNLFLDYIKNKKREFSDIDNNKIFYIKKAEEYFNIKLFDQINNWNETINNEKISSAKFNGNIIQELFPKLKGKELGEAIKNFKVSITHDCNDFFYHKWIINHSIEEILHQFKKINNFK